MDTQITEFDSELWFGLVECVMGYGMDNIKVKFKDRTEIKPWNPKTTERKHSANFWFL